MPSEPSAAGGQRSLRIGKYKVSSPITSWGKGGFYKAVDTEQSQEVALKILPQEIAANVPVRERYREKTQQIADLHHENVVAVHDFGEANGTWFLVVERVEGGDLASFIQHKGPLAACEAQRLLAQAAKGLHQLAQLEGDPPDTSPGGFLVARKNDHTVLKLIPIDLLRDSRLDKPRPSGAGDYRAPEETRGGSGRDLRSAIYSLGGTFFFMLTGRSPRSVGTDLWSAVSGKASAPLLCVLKKMMAKDPKDRYQTPTEILKDLDRPDAEDECDEVVPDADALAGLAGVGDVDALAGLGRAEGEAGPQRREDRTREGISAEARRRGAAPAELPPKGSGDAEEAAGTVREAPANGPSSSGLRPAVKPQSRSTSALDGDEEEAPITGAAGPASWWSNPRVLIGGMAGVIAVLGIVLAILLTNNPKKEPTPNLPSGDTLAGKDKDKDENESDKAKRPGGDKDQAVKNKDKEARDKSKDSKVKKKPKPTWPPALYQPKVAVNVKKLDKDFQGPWSKSTAIPASTPVYRVSRVLPDPGNSKTTRLFNSLAGACAAAPRGQLTIIEIYDNGPLFEVPFTVTGKNLVMRAALGYRPLIVWDLERWKAQAKKEPARGQDQPVSLISVEQGDLMLGNVDLALDWPEDAASSACLVRVSGGDFLSWSSTFSVAGQYKAGVAAVRFEGDAKSARKCRISSCYARGSSLVALDILAPGTDMMVDNCLLVGGNQPLVRCLGQSADGNTPTLRTFRSTVTARSVLFQVQAPAAGSKKLAFRWMGWDNLLVRIGPKADGILLDLPDEASADNLKWLAVNCLYAGWKRLVSGRKPINLEDEEAWKKQWQLPEGDKAVALTWNIPAKADLAIMPAASFAPDRTALAYAATHPPGLLGCDVAKLPWARLKWESLAYRRFEIPDVEVLKEKAAPTIPTAQDGKYYGGRIDVSKVDLGAFLKKQKLASQVVLRLYGRGRCKTSPIYVRNASLVLYFEPTSRGSKPLILVPDPKATKGRFGLIQVEGGSVEIMGGDIRFPEESKADLPNYLVYVWGGNLRIHGARLQGPLTKVPKSFWGLIRLEGSGMTDPTLVRGCTLHQTVLLSGGIGVHISGVGARTRIQQCLMVTGGDALHLGPGRTAPAILNVQCSLEHNTVAARQAVVHIEDTPAWSVLSEPIVIQTQDNVFLNPFLKEDGKKPFPGTVILYDGVALLRGMLAWEGDGDVYDKRLYSYAVAAGADGKLAKDAQAQNYATWQRLWGPLGNSQPHPEVPFKNTIQLDQPRLDQLTVPEAASLKQRHPGADLERLRVLKKKSE